MEEGREVRRRRTKDEESNVSLGRVKRALRGGKMEERREGERIETASSER
jgi:hypothetical protein